MPKPDDYFPVRLFIFFSCLIISVFSTHSLANDGLAHPTGEVILEVSGKIGKTNDTGVALFDRTMIEALPQHTIHTSNHVVSKVTEYRGPLLYDLLESLDFSGTSISAIAWDDYVSILSIDELRKYKVILATHEGGKMLTLDDRGPLFIVFPFSEHKEIQNDLYYNMSVWQLKELAVQ